MSQDLMNYEQMTQLALRGVVRDAIRRVIREDGLPGAHHFYITFLTRYPGVEIDESLAGKYPEEITIVLEHQFWDLNAHADEFEVTLKFGGIPKYLKVPYHAITRFHDPSVGFALQFDPPTEMEPQDTAMVSQITPKPSNKPSLRTKAMTRPTVIGTAKAKAAAGDNTGAHAKETTKTQDEKTLAEKTLAGKTPGEKKLAEKTLASKSKDKANTKSEDKSDKATTEKAEKVVSLDAFRKK